MLQQLKRTIWKAGLVAAILGLLGFTIALAAAGDLDPTFGGDGKQTTDFSNNFDNNLYRLARQSDGKIVAVGYRSDPAHSDANSHNFAVARYNTNGNLDKTFSADGKKLTDFGAVDSAFSVAIQTDSKIVVGGQKCINDVCDIAVARYKTDGNLDTTFSGDGMTVIPFGNGNNGTAGGLSIQLDGKIVVGGFMWNGSGDYDFAVYRLNSNGNLDTTFSGDGKANINFGSGRQDFGEALLLQGNKIVIAGYTCDHSYSNCNFALARLTSSGVLDTTFSGDGKQTTDFGAGDNAYAVAQQTDGKIIAAGARSTFPGGSIAVARYNTDGSLDNTFSSDGKQTISFGYASEGAAVVVQGDGKIVIAGYTCDSSCGKMDFALVRLKAGGSLDTTFSGDGKVSIAFTGNFAHADTLIRQADGKYVLGGTAMVGGQNNFALARVIP